MDASDESALRGLIVLAAIILVGGGVGILAGLGLGLVAAGVMLFMTQML